ncbi:arginase family protein [Pseudomonas syringae]|uniref:arginase family protein n=1 Tax=Pseudomonas syringae TaxID=317 RepID=UPI0011D0B666|nr:arginase family protein [Pseudomonas syringae]
MTDEVRGPIVPGVRLSRYVATLDEIRNGQWQHQLSLCNVGVGTLLRPVLDDILNSESCTFESIIHYIVYYELIDLGFLIPVDIDNEEVYLSGVCPLRKTSSFFGYPFCSFDELPSNTVGVILGLPSHLGSPVGGAKNGPVLLRKASKRQFWRSGLIGDAFTLDGQMHPAAKHNWYDLGDISLHNLGLPDWLNSIELVVKSIPNSVLPVLIGGDHSFSYAAIKATKEKYNRPLCVIQFDHHLDVDLERVPSRDERWRMKSIDHSNFVSHLHAVHPDIYFLHIGSHHLQCAGIGKREAAVSYLRDLGEQVSNTRLLGMSNQDVLAMIPRGYDVYISFDVDVISVSEIRSTGNPAPFGLSLTRAVSLLKDIASKTRVVAFDLMEFGLPDQCIDANVEIEADRLAFLLAEVIGSLNLLSVEGSV